MADAITRSPGLGRTRRPVTTGGNAMLDVHVRGYVVILASLCHAQGRVHVG